MLISTKKNISDNKRKTALSLLLEKVNRGFVINIKIASTSMRPFLCVCDEISIKKVCIKSLSRGDVVVFVKNNYLCVHRYIYSFKQIDGSIRIITKGDNLFNFDNPYVDEDKFVGKVIAVNHKGREISLDSNICKKINYIIALTSSFQVKLLLFLQALRRIFLQNRMFKPGEYIRDGLCVVVLFFQKMIIYIFIRKFGYTQRIDKNA